MPVKVCYLGYALGMETLNRVQGDRLREKTSNVPGFRRYACPPLEGLGGGS